MLGWFGVSPQVSNTLGAEGVGRVLDAGPGVDRALVGRRVVILPTSSRAPGRTRVVVPASNVTPITEDADPK
jgi:NADPH:quinone reductase-like Zn-dependent oxidoreductase